MRFRRPVARVDVCMSLALTLIVIAVVLALIGVFVEAAKILLVVAAILLVVGLVSGALGRGRSSSARI
jgi:hypothetical membrane protein